MDLARPGIDKGGEGVDIGREQFLHSPEFQYLAYYRMAVGDFVERLLVGRVAVVAGLLDAGVQVELLVEHDANLLG